MLEVPRGSRRERTSSNVSEAGGDTAAAGTAIDGSGKVVSKSSPIQRRSGRMPSPPGSPGPAGLERLPKNL